MNNKVQIIAKDPQGNYEHIDEGTLEGFVMETDNTPCGIVSLQDGRFICVPIYQLKKLK